MANLRQNGRIEKVFELAKLLFHRDIKHNFHITVIFLYYEQTYNRGWNRILNPSL